MNNSHSKTEWIYKKRLIGASVKSAIESFPAVVISGARQVGKSTFLKYEFPDFKYVNLDNYSILEQAQTDPASLWLDTDRIIIDEAQKSPQILSAIKLAIDATNRKKKFLISGSSNLLLLKEIGESLAGRAVYFEMFPMSYGEIKGTGNPTNFMKLWDPEIKLKEAHLTSIDPVPLILKGFMPPLMYLSKRNEVLLWWEGYIKTYIERDLRELSQIESLIDFRRFLEACALRTGNILNQTEVSRDIGISQSTVFRYTKLLEVSNIINRVPPYYDNKTKRLIKSPKLFFVDPGLCTYLAGYNDEEALKTSRELGSFFETLIFMHLKIFSSILIPKVNLFYYRTTSGKEVDFILEWGKKLIAIEVKMTNKPTFNDIKNLLAFITEHPRTTRGILVHTGSSIQWLHSKVVAVPWWWLVS
jgi:predicted AAA+ superfamily ATPase